MTLNKKLLSEFCDRWAEKSKNKTGNDCSDAYDRFFTLWIIYNRLYQESSRIMIANASPVYKKHLKHISQGRKKRYSPAPDRLSATRGVVSFCEGSISLPKEAVDYVIKTIKDGLFYYHENYDDLTADKKRDLQLADKCDEISMLELIYQARCNLFHGDKDYSASQEQLLLSMGDILESTIAALKYKLEIPGSQ